MKTVLLDGTKLKTKAQVHDMLARELDFGPYYGKNLDALWDVITEPYGPFEIIWEHSEESRVALAGC